MKALRIVLASALLVSPLAQAEEDAAFGHALTLVQIFVRAAAQAPGDPQAGLKAFDDVASGRNAEASQALNGLFEEMTTGMPAQHKDKVAMIGRDLASLARVEAARAPSLPQISTDRALQARKDLTAMGLKYFDNAQYLDAVKRDDALAVELYLLGRGINPAATDARGRTALDIARANKNPQLAELISRNLPGAR
ncbi:MAG TPA: hypothetical protein VEB41_15335 [Burkholderiales bacterium]|nr:hypothetical protein [Burkholderiales bacterium]